MALHAQLVMHSWSIHAYFLLVTFCIRLFGANKIRQWQCLTISEGLKIAISLCLYICADSETYTSTAYVLRLLYSAMSMISTRLFDWIIELELELFIARSKLCKTAICLWLFAWLMAFYFEGKDVNLSEGMHGNFRTGSIASVLHVRWLKENIEYEY